MENSKIEWTDHTWNPWTGCIKVSPGCKFCYAETLSNRWGKDVWGPGPKRQRTSESYWRNPIKWNKQAIKEGRRFRVFCASMADVFEDNPQLEPWRVDLLNLIQDTPNLDWLLLTKRPEHVNRMIEQATGFSDSGMWFHTAPHVQIGTSIENQEYADERIPELLKIPARIRFLSIEPLLGPVNLHSGLSGMGGQFCHKCGKFSWYEDDGNFCPHCGHAAFTTHARIHWVIVGGESGPGARPMHPKWARGIRNQCQAAGIPFLFKQWGEYLPVFNSYITPDGYNFSKVGKKAAGRILDGRTWDEFPRGGR